MLLTLAPGPDILFVIVQSISQGKRAGIAVALGLCTGLIVHTTAAALGISVILNQSTAAFQLVKYAGAVYLLYLVWQAFKEGDTSFSMKEAKNQQFISLYKRGIFMNILNPKVSLFFLAFLPQFVSAELGKIPFQMIILGIIFMAQAFIIFTGTALFSVSFSQRFFSNHKIGKYINYFKAIIFAVIGIRLAFMEK
ncbi:LysE family translocator [Bacillus taeanensis]|uniref:LysE family translocator n=2 Tax=Bacillus taeanensis TaxID=273032 RepID=A0A366XV73_9BACI|nr:LysE family translocator [Bacillus taeanensis]